MPRQPWYKEGRRPQRVETCSNCGRTFRDKRTAEEALLEAIFGELLCPQCKQKRDFVTCTACNEPIERGREFTFEGKPYHSKCLAKEVGADIPTYCIHCRRTNGQHDEGCLGAER